MKDVENSKIKKNHWYSFSGECTGPSTRYISCNIEECIGNVKDFRAIQCSKYDDTPLDGNYYKWIPYPGKNKCELTCKPDNANFYYKWADKVIFIFFIFLEFLFNWKEKS